MQTKTNHQNPKLPENTLVESGFPPPREFSATITHTLSEIGCRWTLYLPWKHAAGSRPALREQPGWRPPRGGGTLPIVPVRAASCRQQIQCSIIPAEVRISKSEGRPQPDSTCRLGLRISDFFRISALGFRIWATVISSEAWDEIRRRHIRHNTSGITGRLPPAFLHS